MRIARTLDELDREVSALRAGGRRLAIVPTMGALHGGHVALIGIGRRRADRVAASIFVNPLQFNSADDLARYPRDEASDLEKLSAAGCDLAWLPGAEAMYPPGTVTTIDVGGPAEGWEGAHRPGHFRGVATVCTKLFLQTRADLAIFGEKDWQQVQVIRRVVADLNIPIEIVPVPTIREADGLAMSSRNRFLTPAERATAPRLAATLDATARAIARDHAPGRAIAAAIATLEADGFVVEYLARVVPETMRAMSEDDRGPGRLIAVARLGAVRLLDNWPVAARGA
ncbi:MAG: pantoate--beta-alanine ligase [Alphaproteobacteria bacterium]|nr:pantoate--beta-alanine ligase [Alphaproteobacteria bacterium]